MAETPEYSHTDGETMRTESLQSRMRALLRSLLQELDVAEACIEEIRYAVRVQASMPATAAALSLYRAWARAERAIEPSPLLLNG